MARYLPDPCDGLPLCWLGLSADYLPAQRDGSRREALLVQFAQLVRERCGIGACRSSSEVQAVRRSINGRAKELRARQKQLARKQERIEVESELLSVQQANEALQLWRERRAICVELARLLLTDRVAREGRPPTAATASFALVECIVEMLGENATVVMRAVYGQLVDCDSFVEREARAFRVWRCKRPDNDPV